MITPGSASCSSTLHLSIMDPCIARPLDIVRAAFTTAPDSKAGDFGVRRRFEEALADPATFAQVRLV